VDQSFRLIGSSDWSELKESNFLESKKRAWQLYLGLSIFEGLLCFVFLIFFGPLPLIRIYVFLIHCMLCV